MSQAPLRVAQVGVGGMGLAHVRAVDASARAEMVALCDQNDAALTTAANGRDLPCFRDALKLFDAVEFDALIAVLPHDLYPTILGLAAQRGIAVLKEKPFARNLTDAMAMYSAIDLSGIPFLCGAQRQFATPFRRAHELLLGGEVGEVFLTEGAITYPWNVDGGWGWRGQRARSGGIAVVDSGWHILDAIAWLKGLPTSVYCRLGTLKAAGGEYDVDDKAVLAFDFGDGSIGSMTACFVTVPGRYEVRLHGTQGTLELTTSKLVLYPRRGGEPLVVEDDGTDLIAAQFEHFCDVVLDGATPRVGAEQALHLQRVVEAAYESAGTGRAVDLMW